MVPTGREPVAEVVVGREREAGSGWDFEVSVIRGGARSEHRVRLSWVDYEHWSHGTAAPERVVKAVVAAVIDLDRSREIPAAFDASTARRWVAGLDERVRERVGGVG